LPQPLNSVMIGGTVGEVVESRHPGFAAGDKVVGMGGWQTYSVVDADTPGMLRKIDTKHVPISHFLGAVGMPGVTAWHGLVRIIEPKAGQTLTVSAASGAVGSAFGALAKARGCRVIGIAGGKDKCDYVTNELGFDACIDYKNEDVGTALDRLCPSGIDINFEQVGGPIMVEVMKRMKLFGRIALCGMISSYNDVTPNEPPGFWTMILMRRLLIRGFIVTDFAPRFGESGMALAGWMLGGQLKTRQDIRPGLENAVSAVKELYTGGNFGKLLIEVSKP
jgi:NADPH-dependent curcumin reductase CurA